MTSQQRQKETRTMNADRAAADAISMAEAHADPTKKCQKPTTAKGDPHNECR